MGRHTEFTDEIEERANEYINGGFEECGDVIPSIVGLAIELKVNKSTLYKWSDDGHGDFSNTLANCMDAQHRVLINKGLTGDFNATIAKLALSNHGYSEKTETDITSGGERISGLSNDELEARLKQLESE